MWRTSPPPLFRTIWLHYALTLLVTSTTVPYCPPTLPIVFHPALSCPEAQCRLLRSLSGFGDLGVGWAGSLGGFLASCLCDWVDVGWSFVEIWGIVNFVNFVGSWDAL